jgi:hypothetical protein
MARRDRTVPLQVTRSARILVIEDHTDTVDLRLVRELAACAPSGGVAGGSFVALRAESCQRRA